MSTLRQKRDDENVIDRFDDRPDKPVKNVEDDAQRDHNTCQHNFKWIQLN